ncbi:MAG TPA: UV DNA damage repair endonuclease UvsE [Pirellulales bacterium]
MLRLGLCCQFRDAPIKFGTTTAAHLAKLSHAERSEKLSRLCAANAAALLESLRFCSQNGIGCFRVNSQILPLRTHPTLGYSLEELPNGPAIIAAFRDSGRFAAAHHIRTAFHPDQFVVLNSQRPEVVESSLKELEHQAEVAEWIGADVVNIHGGGAFGDKTRSLAAFAATLDRLSDRARSRLTVENDDKIYTPADLLPLCRATGLPLVYDAHHHRCLGDGLSVEAATELALSTWSREPLFHISSPLEGWSGPKPERHHDFIDVNDFPAGWLTQALTVEVEAKAKEAAVLKLKSDLAALTTGGAALS